jgi:endonuclease I
MKKLLLTILSTFLLVGCGQNDISSLSISEDSFSSITTSEEDTSSSSTFETTSLETYYESATGTGMELLNQLHKITETNFKTITYKGLWEAYKTTDVRTDGKVMDIYSNITNYTFGTDQAGSYKKEGDYYNREHTIPQSWWGKGTTNQGCDIFIVYPSDGYVNNIRGNLPYGEVKTSDYNSANDYCRRGTSALTGYSGTVFEIADEWKGDIARSCFYSLTKWTNAPTWTSSEGSVIFSGSYNTNYGLTDYALNLYLKWHREDPVSEWEQQRNDRCEEVQGNRNPYIDNPSFVESIWGSYN